jgi:hypothetical protein
MDMVKRWGREELRGEKRAMSGELESEKAEVEEVRSSESEVRGEVLSLGLEVEELTEDRRRETEALIEKLSNR